METAMRWAVLNIFAEFADENGIKFSRNCKVGVNNSNDFKITRRIADEDFVRCLKTPHRSDPSGAIRRKFKYSHCQRGKLAGTVVNRIVRG